MEPTREMIKDYRIEVVIPAGRELTMSLLMPHLYRNKDVIDKVQIWQNTDNHQEEDRRYLYSLPEQYGDWVEIIEREGEVLEPKQLNTGTFYKHTIDPSTIYFRFDDDIVYIDDNYFENMVAYRLDHPEYFLVFGNIWNNAIISYIQQQKGRIDESCGKVRSAFCMDQVGWLSPTFAEHIHRILLEHIKNDTTQELYFDDYVLDGDSRFSVSNFCYFGHDFAKFGGDLEGAEEEQWLTEVYPPSIDRKNVICGTGLVSHFSFFSQRSHLLNNTDILDQYRKVAQQKLSDSYYKLLAVSNKNQV
jgi:hypothetical protein